MRTLASNKAICIILLILIHLVIIICDYYNDICYLIILSTSINSKVIKQCLDMITRLIRILKSQIWVTIMKVIGIRSITY